MVGLSLKFKINATEVMVGLSPQAKFGKTLIVGEGKNSKSIVLRSNNRTSL